MRWSGWVAGSVIATSLVLAGAGTNRPGSPASAQADQVGSVLSYGDAGAYGGPSALNAPVVGMAPTPDGRGYWLVASDGGVFTYGDAPFAGSGQATGYRFAGLSPTPDGQGYLLTDDQGDVTAYGDAQVFGSLNGIQPGSVAVDLYTSNIVGIAETPDGRGYWLVASDGGVFAFGDAPFLGSMGGSPINSPVVGMAATHDGRGYWLVASDGGVFAFGDARFVGSPGGTALNVPVVGIAPTKSGNGYWLAAGDGGVFSYGDATFDGSAGAAPPPHPVAAIAATPDGGGYWLSTSVTGPTPVPVDPLVQSGCYNPAVRPSSLVLACADHNSVLQDLRWSMWTATVATGSGTYAYNTCVPYCAAGTLINTPTAVSLQAPVSTSAGVEFSRVTWTYTRTPGGLVTQTQRLGTDP